MGRNTRPSAHAPSPTEHSPRPLRGGLGLGALAGLVLVLALVPAAGATTVAAPAHPAAPLSVANGTWAWGAFENATFESTYLGAYADMFNLTNGNFSAARAIVGEAEKLHAEYGAFTVVTATNPTTSTRSVEAISVALANYSGYVVVAGNLPAPGTYAPGATVPLVNVTGIYYASILEIAAYVAFANYTISNTSLSLANEHVESWVGLNTTTIAYHWPGATHNANGTTTIAYTTAAAVELAFVAQSVSINFTPAVPLAEYPLTVGHSWNATTSAKIVGWSAYAVAMAYSNGVTNASSRNAGSASLNTTAALNFQFDVVGSQSVIFPNGTTETGYIVQATENGTGTSAYVLWDGLVVLPAGSSTAAAPARPSGPLASVTPLLSTGATASRAIVTASGMPVATSSSVTAATTLTTAPLAPDQARSQISTAGVPAHPGTPVPPSVSSPPNTSTPPYTGTTPRGNTPTGSPPSVSKGWAPSMTLVLLALAVAGIAAAFLAVELVRERRHR